MSEKSIFDKNKKNGFTFFSSYENDKNNCIKQLCIKYPQMVDM